VSWDSWCAQHAGMTEPGRDAGEMQMFVLLFSQQAGSSHGCQEWPGASWCSLPQLRNTPSAWTVHFGQQIVKTVVSHSEDAEAARISVGVACCSLRRVLWCVCCRSGMLCLARWRGEPPSWWRGSTSCRGSHATVPRGHCMHSHGEWHTVTVSSRAAVYGLMNLLIAGQH
jgi:hypothetical protein